MFRVSRERRARVACPRGVLPRIQSGRSGRAGTRHLAVSRPGPVSSRARPVPSASRARSDCHADDSRAPGDARAKRHAAFRSSRLGSRSLGPGTAQTGSLRVRARRRQALLHRQHPGLPLGVPLHLIAEKIELRSSVRRLGVDRAAVEEKTNGAGQQGEYGNEKCRPRHFVRGYSGHSGKRALLTNGPPGVVGRIALGVLFGDLLVPEVDPSFTFVGPCWVLGWSGRDGRRSDFRRCLRLASEHAFDVFPELHTSGLYDTSPNPLSAHQLRTSRYPCRAVSSGLERQQGDALETPKPAAYERVSACIPSRGDRTRTCNPRFWRPVRYQLRHAPRFAGRIVSAVSAVASSRVPGRAFHADHGGICGDRGLQRDGVAVADRGRFRRSGGLDGLACLLRTKENEVLARILL